MVTEGHRTLVFLPRTESGVSLAFRLADVAPGLSIQGLAFEVFRDHLTAATIDVYDQDTLICTLVRPAPLDPSLDRLRYGAQRLGPSHGSDASPD
jgi:hypothetical protein